MHTITPKKKDSLVLTVPAPRPRLRFVGRMRNGGGVHQDRRRRNDRTVVKVRLRRGEE